MREIYTTLICVVLSLTCFSQISFDNYEAALNLSNSAMLDIKNHDYASSIPKLEKAIILDSTNRNLYRNLYKSYNQINFVMPLIPYLEKAKQIFLEDDEIYYYTGNVFQKLNKYDNAIQNYDSAIIYSKLNGEDFILVYAYYLNRGICYYKQNKYENALSDFTYALKLQNNKSSIYTNRGNTYFNLKLVREACLDWSRAYELGEKTVLEKINIYCNN